MARQYNVKSKYKNPDKFIEKLKSELKLKNTDIEFYLNENQKLVKDNIQLRDKFYGKLWFVYQEDVTHSVEFIHEPLKKSEQGAVGDDVVILGKIIEITQSETKEKASAVFQTHTVFLKKNDK